jgi:hypothetical protein
VLAPRGVQRSAADPGVLAVGCFGVGGDCCGCATMGVKIALMAPSV